LRLLTGDLHGYFDKLAHPLFVGGLVIASAALYLPAELTEPVSVAAGTSGTTSTGNPGVRPKSVIN
jgi:hypothetical protein